MKRMNIRVWHDYALVYFLSVFFLYLIYKTVRRARSPVLVDGRLTMHGWKIGHGASRGLDLVST